MILRGVICLLTGKGFLKALKEGELDVESWLIDVSSALEGESRESSSHRDIAGGGLVKSFLIH